MNAAVLSIGTEITRGELTNSNAAWLGESLTTLGYPVLLHLSIPDEIESIAETLRDLGERVQVVVVTGGLGPTTDDMTAEAAARAARVELVCDEALLAEVRRKYQSRGRQLSTQGEKQAHIPAGATPLRNTVGTAPGFWLELGQARCFFLPGVPREMREMFGERVLPVIAESAPADTHQVSLRTFGLPESRVGELLAGLEEEHQGITLGYRASFPEVEVKVLATADGAQAAVTQAREVAKVVRERLGEAVYGDGEDTYPSALGDVLRERRWSISVAESCTGGLVGQMLTSVPGSSDYLRLDAVVYANSAKTRVLGVEPDILRGYGAVSGETAAAMADGARRLGDTDVAVSITGIAGPGGGTDDKPVGTVWFGLSFREGKSITMRHHLHGDRERVRTRAAYIALEAVRRAALGLDPITGAYCETLQEAHASGRPPSENTPRPPSPDVAVTS